MSKVDIEDPEELWRAFLVHAKERVSGHVYETWLKPLRCAEIAGETVRLEVRDQFSRDWLCDHYCDFIRDGLAELLGAAIAVDLVVNPALAVRSEPDPEEPQQVESTKERRVHLNPRYIFSSFVSGPSNQFALAAARAVADKPALSYNPLFLFGGTGLGKTHLLSAIGHQVLASKPEAKIIYTSSEQFMNEVVNAVRFSTMDAFHQKYRRNCDILLIDDIQMIAGKDRTQHEFFHIFNTLYDLQRQIVVTSDRLPHEIPEIEERLRTRFQWGLIADIQPPEYETRVAILRKKAMTDGLPLNAEVTDFLAKNIRSNVRELEGALVRIVAHASLTGATITLDYARQVLADVLVSRAQSISVESIQKLVAQYFQVRVLDIKSQRRMKVLVRPRQVAMYLSRKHAGASYPDLGQRFGDKDHTTIMSACKKIEARLKEDPSLRSQVLEIERQLDVHTKQ